MQHDDREEASAIALMAFAFILEDSALRMRFLDLSGVDAASLRESLADPHFLAAILDFLLGHEPDLLAFCAANGIDPTLPARARRRLEHF